VLPVDIHHSLSPALSARKPHFAGCLSLADCPEKTVRRFGGFVAKYMGDGVLVYFGYPQAHEDDAERAVRTGLELIAAAAGLKTRAPLQTRVGIATGLVVVGDLIGSGEAQDHGIVGETPNLAARLQGIAEPNMVVIAEGARKLLGNLFELEDLVAKDPATAWQVLRRAEMACRDGTGWLEWEDSNSQMRFKNWPLKCGSNFPSFRNVWRSETFPG
jgi:class 3 adenylate cyclase